MDLSLRNMHTYCLAAIVAAATMILGACAGIEKKPGLFDLVFAPAASELDVMTFNVRYGTANDGPDAWDKRRALFMDTIKARMPDVLCVQEALRFQLDEIREAMPEYAEAGVGRDDGRIKGEYAAILYKRDRWRVDEEKTFWFSDTPDVPGSKGWGASLPRICTFVLLTERKTNRMVHVYNVHLDNASAQSRARSAHLLAEAVLTTRMIGVPAVVTGDFNEGEGGVVVHYLTGRAERASDDAHAGRTPSPKLLDTFRAIHPNDEAVGTFNGFKGEKTGPKIDYILVDRNIEVLDAGIDRTERDGHTPSDHFPVWARIRLPK